MHLPLLPRELHTTDRPSATAQWTTLGRALELSRSDRIVTDPYAPVFLSTASRAVWWQLRLAGPAVRLAERAPVAGVSAFALCRHRMIDEHLLAALEGGVEQVLILGAGYDSRAYRFADELAGRPVYEVDLPPLSRRKAAIVASRPELFGGNTIDRVEIDFRTQTLGDRLAASGFTFGATTFVAWEGVAMYLTVDAVGETLSTLRDVCGTGSRVAMDCWFPATGLGPSDVARRVATRAFSLVGEPVTFALPPDRVDGFLGLHGFEVVDLARHDELAARYSTGGRPCEESVYVLAADLA